ncbi:MAG: proprotein convertase P-domain-containing protein [Microcoleaceae cyanobacterium]
MSSEIVVDEVSLIQGIPVKVEIEHQYLGDLSIELFAPNGKNVLLQNRNLGAQTHFKQIYTLNNAPFLSQLLQLSAEGIWRLVIVDYVVCHIGQLKGWELGLEF